MAFKKYNCFPKVKNSDYLSKQQLHAYTHVQLYL